MDQLVSCAINYGVVAARLPRNDKEITYWYREINLRANLLRRTPANAQPTKSDAMERIARDIVMAVIGMPRIKPHPDLVAKVVSLLRQEGW